MERNFKVFTDPRNKEEKEKSYHVLVKESTKIRLNKVKSIIQNGIANDVSNNDVISILIDNFNADKFVSPFTPGIRTSTNLGDGTNNSDINPTI